MIREEIASHLDSVFSGFQPEDFPAGTELYKGKVRDVVSLDREMLIITSDRISAFDRILSTIPCKGEVLNLMALYWFGQTEDILANHIVEKISARSIRVKKCKVLPVEVIVRGYLTGSAWRDYTQGRQVSGINIPAGMRFNQKFDTPLLTPSTKAEQGLHDEPISSEEIVARGLVEERLWRQVEEKALALFARGSEILASRGLLLVDTKYEFGILDGELVLVDEIHTPDSSRFWFADTYQELFRSGENQRKIDKEYLRQWLMDRDFMGQGPAPEIPEEVRIEVAWRYIQAYQLITGTDFHPSGSGADEEKSRILSRL